VVYIGTSGYAYPHWTGVFYPPDLPKEGQLPFYSRHFPTVEVNYTFYHFPSERTVERWAETTPEGFVFSVKAHRTFTHRRKLGASEESLRAFLGRLFPLGDKLGPVLFQLPPKLGPDLGKLSAFLEKLPAGFRYAMEFRDERWLGEETLSLLREKGIAYCIVSAPGLRTLPEVTASFAYVRLHGSGAWYSHRYTEEELRTWAEIVRSLDERAEETFVYFNNDYKGYAVENALTLMALLKGAVCGG